MKTRALRLFILLVVVFPQLSGAQFLRYRNYDVEDGLPSYEVYSMLQDKRGFMWFTTDMGVSRYDGYAFTNYSTEHGLPDNTIFNVYEDAVGRIWFTSFSGQLAYFENEKISTPACNEKLRKLLKGHFITTVYRDEGDTIWLGTTNSIAIRIAPPWTADKVDTLSFRNAVGYFCVIDSNAVITGGGFSARGELDVFEKNVFQYTITAIENYEGPAGTRYSCLPLGNGKFLATANDNIFCFNGQEILRRSKLNGIGICMTMTDEATVAVGSYVGVQHFSVDSLQMIGSVQKLDHKIVTAILRDRENGTWYCTEGNGVYAVAYNSFLYYTIEDGLTDSKITCAAVMNDLMMLGHINGSVSILRDKEIRIVNLEEGIPGNSSGGRVATLLPGEGNELVAATGNGIFQIDVMTLASRLVVERGAKKIIRARSGILWAFRFRRLVKIDGTTFECSEGEVFPIYADNLFEDSKGKLWICAIDGVWTYDSINGFESRAKADSSMSVRVVDVGETNHHTMWFATRGSGVIVETQDTVFQIQRSNGLAGNMCRTLFIDTGHTIWVGTNSGLSKIYFTESPEFSYTVETYTTDAGLLTNEVNEILRIDHKLVLVHTSCVSVFDPRDLANNSFAPPVYITSATQTSHSTFIDGATFEHTRNYFTFGYVGISYRDPGKIHYRYKMDGAETDWHYTTSTSASYQSLQPGDYRFIVEANTGGTTWASNASIGFTILPAWWQTWVFRTGVAVLIILFGYLLFRWRINIINRRHIRKTALQNRLATFELNALRAQMNPHFVFNAINSVQYFITENDPDSSQKYLSKFAKLIRYVVDNSRLSYISVKAEIEALTLYLELEALRFGDRMKYSFVIDDDVDIEYLQIPSMLIQPYVENSIWHGIMHKEGNGEVVIHFSMKDNMLCVVIEDDGVGRTRAMEIKKNKPVSSHKSIGMTNTRERLEIINQVSKSDLTVEVTDLYSERNEPCGTRVELRVPINHQ